MVAGFGLIALIVLVAAAMWIHRKVQRTRLSSTVAYYQARALQIARRDFGVDLDFSDISIVHVDNILEEIGRRTRDESFDATEFAAAFGFYVGEVIRRNEGEGLWDRDHPEFGALCYPLYVRETAAFPLAWCWKRIENGPEDNLVHKMNIMRHAA